MQKIAMPRAVTRLINNYLIYRQVVTIKVSKLYSREKNIAVDYHESWKDFILINSGDLV